MKASAAPSTWQSLKDGVFFPLRCLLSSEAAGGLGLTPIDDERLRMVLPYCRGKILDIGCGPNRLVREYGNGIGVDVHPWQGIDVLCDTTRQPFRDETFDTVVMLACLNHIVEKEGVLGEARRILKPGGRLLVTMIGPVTGLFCHVIRRRYDPDQMERGIDQDEQYGLSGRRIRELLRRQRFGIESGTSCLFGLNRLYIGSRAG
jgi:SAM-dependent methyltransferase